MPASFAKAIQDLAATPRDGDVSADALRQIVYGILSQPRRLADAVPDIARLIGRDEGETKALIVEMVRVSWIQEAVTTPQLDRPIFLIAAPRAGAHLLFEQLMRIPGVWSVGGESHHIFDPVLRHGLANPKFKSVRAISADATPQRTTQIVRRITRLLGSAASSKMYLDMPIADRPPLVRVLDKLPNNAYRIPFLNECFPDARFVFFVREPRGNISSLIDAWREGAKSGRFVRYKNLPGSIHEKWCFSLPPGWEHLAKSPIEHIAAYQWTSANEFALRDLSLLSQDRWIISNYVTLVRNPLGQLRRLCDFLQLPFDPARLDLEGGKLRFSKMTLTPPHAEKWKSNEEAVEKVLPLLRPTSTRLANLLMAEDQPRVSTRSHDVVDADMGVR